MNDSRAPSQRIEVDLRVSVDGTDVWLHTVEVWPNRGLRLIASADGPVNGMDLLEENLIQTRPSFARDRCSVGVDTDPLGIVRVEWVLPLHEPVTRLVVDGAAVDLK